MKLEKEKIKALSYDYKNCKMIIKLKEKQMINNYMTDEVAYKCSEDMFIKSLNKLFKDKNEKDN